MLPNWDKQKLIKLKLLLTLLILPCIALSAINVLHEIKHDTVYPFGKNVKLSNYVTTPDLNLQQTPTQNQIPVTVFAGMGVGFENYIVHTLNPDVQGSVGMNQYLQIVNYDIAIFDKQTGKIYEGFPKPNNSLWRHFGGQCENELGKYANVKYDQLDHRWVITHTTSSNLCVAISTSEDATGAFHRYAFNLNARAVNAKFGLWPNAYFMSFDIRNKIRYTDSLVCALDRKQMLLGNAATAQCKIVPKHFDTIIHTSPADLEGTYLPFENGLPGYYIGLFHEPHSETLLTFQFYVDFVDPNHSGLRRIQKLRIEPNRVIKKARQPSDYLLDVDNSQISLNSRVVYRAWRPAQFMQEGSLMGVHTSNDSNGLYFRWFELRNYRFDWDSATDNFYFYQAGYPQQIQQYDRYTASITEDRAFNIVVGNSMSSSSLYPSIEINWQNSSRSDSLPFHQILLIGQGSQTATPVNKWGPNSSLSLDPKDDCTFWYTNAYLKTTGNYNWSTAIFHFKLPNCI